MTDPRYQETVAYLYSLLPMYQRLGSAAFKKDLSNTQALCWELGLPQWKFESVHIGGTNGKGSVSAMVSSILIEAGKKTGQYTSPHLLNFTERIRVNGQEISQKGVVEFVDAYRSVIESVKPSFFELTVAMAFEHFAEQWVDAAVIEVGLGGRLDSTNIIRPEVSVITHIAFDHMDLLGNTLAAIAEEKAGIIKPYTPVVIGRRQPETAPIFETRSRQLQAPLFYAEDEIRLKRVAGNNLTQTFAVHYLRAARRTTYELGLAGLYQGENLATALTTIEMFREIGWEIPEEAVVKGLKRVIANSGLLGRMQLLQATPKVLCDTAHNEAGIQAVMQQLQHIPHRQLHMVWGSVSDKEHDRIFALLPKTATYYYVRPDVPRGLDEDILALKAGALGFKGKAYDSVAAGIQAALAVADPADLIYIGGSTFVVAEALPLFEKDLLTQ